MGPRGGGGFGFLHMITGLVGMLLCVAIVLGLAALAYKLAVKKGWLKGWHQPGHAAGPESGQRHEPGAPPAPYVPAKALRILDERLARGEVDVDDYQARRDALTGNSFPPFHQPPPPPTPPADVPPQHSDGQAPQAPPAQ